MNNYKRTEEEMLYELRKAQNSAEYDVIQRLPFVKLHNLHNVDPVVRSLCYVLRQTENPYLALDKAIEYYSNREKELNKTIDYFINLHGSIEQRKIQFKRENE